WELGYMDGYRGKVFVFPLAADVVEGNTGQEYLDAYPVVDRERLQAFLSLHLPKTGNPILDRPLFAPADQYHTAEYGKWMERNAFDLATNPESFMKFWGDVWQAYFRLWTGRGL